MWFQHVFSTCVPNLILIDKINLVLLIKSINLKYKYSCSVLGPGLPYNKPYLFVVLASPVDLTITPSWPMVCVYLSKCVCVCDPCHPGDYFGHVFVLAPLFNLLLTHQWGWADWPSFPDTTQIMAFLETLSIKHLHRTVIISLMCQFPTHPSKVSFF